jgi:hypothetical protein
MLQTIAVGWFAVRSDFSLEVGVKGAEKVRWVSVSRTTAKKTRLYNFGCKSVLLSVQFVQPLSGLDLQPEEVKRRLWLGRRAGLLRDTGSTRSSKL